jgi:hypothetical protein
MKIGGGGGYLGAAIQSEVNPYLFLVAYLMTVSNYII